jgi:hypothetical protein
MRPIFHNKGHSPFPSCFQEYSANVHSRILEPSSKLQRPLLPIMSVFSKLKLSKRAADEHKAAAAASNQGEEAPVVKEKYKHIPTHAAFDALSGAPSSWKHEDKPKIMEHNKRRSQMSSLSRNGSTLTFHATPSEDIPAVPSLPRNASYSSFNPTWSNRGDHSVLYEHLSRPSSKRPSRTQSFVNSPQRSRFASKSKCFVILLQTHY